MVYDFNFSLFCDTFDLPPVPTRNALLILTRAGYLEYIDETTSRSRIMVLMKRDELYNQHLDNDEEEVLQCILRRYTGLFADYVYISELTIAETLRMSSEQVYKALLTLGRLHVIHYIPRKTTPYLIYPTSREEPRYIVIPTDVYERQRERMEQRIDAMKAFTFDTDKCRANTLLRYFGENPGQPCGKCDVCRASRQRTAANAPALSDSIRYQASHPGGIAVTALVDSLGPHYGHDNVTDTIRTLLDRNILRLTDGKLATR